MAVLNELAKTQQEIQAPSASTQGLQNVNPYRAKASNLSGTLNSIMNNTNQLAGNIARQMEGEKKEELQLNVDMAKEIAMNNARDLSTQTRQLQESVIKGEVSRMDATKQLNDLVVSQGAINEENLSDEAKDVYRRLYTEPANDTASKLGLQWGKEQYGIDQEEVAKHTDLAIQTMGKDITPEQLAALKQGLTNYQLDDSKVEGVLFNYIKKQWDADLAKNPNVFYSKGGREAKIEEYFGSLKDSENTAIKSAISEVDGLTKQNTYKYWKAEQAKVDDSFSKSIYKSAVNDPSLANIQKLIGAVRGAKGASDDVRFRLVNSLGARVRSLKSDIDAADKKKAKIIKLGVEQSAVSFMDKIKFNTNEGLTMNQGAISFLANPDAIQQYNNLLENYKAIYADNPKKLYEETTKLDEEWNKANKVSQQITYALSNGVNEEYFHPDTKAVVKNIGNRAISSFLSLKQPTQQDSMDLAKTISMSNGVPDAMVSITQESIATADINSLNTIYNSMIITTQTDNQRMNKRNLLKYKNNQTLSSLLKGYTWAKDPATGQVNVEKATMLLQKMNDPETKNVVTTAKSRILGSLKYKVTNEYSTESVNSIAEEIAFDSVISGEPVVDSAEAFKDKLKERTLVTDDATILDIKGTYNLDTLNELVKVSKVAMSGLVADDAKVKVDVNPSTGGIKLTQNGYTLFTTNSKSEIGSLMSALSVASKVVKHNAEVKEAKDEADEEKLEEINNNARISPLLGSQYDIDEAGEVITKIKADILGMTNTIGKVLGKEAEKNGKFLEDAYRKVGAK